MNNNNEHRDFWIFRAFVLSFALFVFFAFNDTGNSNEPFEDNTASTSSASYSNCSAILVTTSDFLNSVKLNISSDNSFLKYSPNYNHFRSCKEKETSVQVREWATQYLNRKPISIKFFSIPNYSSGSLDDFPLIS